MRKLALLLLLALPVAAQNFGEPFPLTNTRYDATVAYDTRLVSNGRDFFAFWRDPQQLLRLTRVDDGEPRPGLALVSLWGSDPDFDVVWTGAHFLAAYETETGMAVRLFDEEGKAQSEPRPLRMIEPHLAFNGKTVLLAGYDMEQMTSQVLALAPDGRPLGAAVPLERLAAPLSAASDGNGFAVVVYNNAGLSLAIFDAEGRLASKRLLRAVSPHGGQYLYAALAGSSGRYLLAHCDREDRVACDVTSFDANGNTIGSVALTTRGPNDYARWPAAVWDGAGWTVAYHKWTPIPNDVVKALHVVRVDPTGQTILSDDETPADRPPALAAMGSRVRMAWHPDWYEPLSTAELPLREGGIRPLAYVAASQQLIATETAAAGTLVVWMERRESGARLHAGIRRRSGEWIERELASSTYAYQLFARTATDGRDFVIAWEGKVVCLTSWGWMRWSIEPPLAIQAMAWNGSVYGVIGSTGERETYKRVITTMTRSGQFAAPIPTPSGYGASDLASDGHGFLQVAGGSCVTPGCGLRVAAIRLGPDMQPLEEPFTLSDYLFSADPHVLWDGSDYVVTWAEDGCMVARIPSSSAWPYSVVARRDLGCTAGPVLAGTRLAFAWEEPYRNQPRTHVAVVSAGGSATHSFSRPWPATGEATVQPAGLPGGGFALVRSSAVVEVPYYQTSRLMMQIAAPSPPVKPAPPSNVSVTGKVITWMPPPQPVAGYRIEYRTGDAPWKELDGWIGGSARSFELPIAADEFRMRAWSEGGVSGYSNAFVVR